MSDDENPLSFLMPISGLRVYCAPLLAGCKDKDGNPIHATQLEPGGPVYVVPEFFDKLKAEIDSLGVQ